VELFKTKKKRGRPKKKIEEIKEDEFPEDADIEVMEAGLTLRGPFSLKSFGIIEDPMKQYRWVNPLRIDERKHNGGFRFVKGKNPDGTVRTKGNMVLMERSSRIADERTKMKMEAVARQTSTSREDFDRRMEELSQKHGRNLN